MIEIPEPPTQKNCTSCWGNLSWLFSGRNRSWLAVVRVGEDTMRIHDCNLPGAPSGWPTWRTVPKGSPPTAVYLAARAALQERTDSEETP